MRRAASITGFLLFSVLSALSAEDPVLYAPDFADPGGVVQVTVPGDPLTDMVVTLQDSKGVILSRSEGFVWRTPTGREVSAALIGIPPTAAPGRYRLVMSGDQGKAQWHLEKTIHINDSVFPEQVIVLSDGMNTLLTDDSERKKSEARELWAVISSFNQDAVHHLGRLSMPLQGGLPTAAFGDRRRYRMPDGSESSSIHFGRDLWAERGTPVTAAGSGRVVLAAERFLTGNTVIIEHLPGVFTLYYHLDSIAVGVGETVRTGGLIGTLGDTGFATGEHLHWEMRVGATPVNPEIFITRPLLDTNELMSKM